MTVALFGSTDSFVNRHIGPDRKEIQRMVESLGQTSLSALIDSTVPARIRLKQELSSEWIGQGASEQELLAELKTFASRNQVFRSFIGMGYSDCVTPPVILRNILENPGWYTQYTPYQAEIAQGRLEALLNFQTMIAELTHMEIANASLLDEGTAAAEAMAMCHAIRAQGGQDAGKVYFVSSDCHPQTIEVLRGRAEPIGVQVVVGDIAGDIPAGTFGALAQYPGSSGVIPDLRAFVEKFHAANALACVAADLLALTLLKAPGEFGADIVVGSAQRFGVPMGYGGPHAAFLATREEHKRQIAGRLVGVSKDAEGRPAIRLALQTREQHIRRDKATSNICTAQVLLAIMASMYAVYHGSEGLKEIARRIHKMTAALEAGLRHLGYHLADGARFDTITVPLKGGPKAMEEILAAALALKINLRKVDGQTLGISLDETTSAQDLEDLLKIFSGATKGAPALSALAAQAKADYPAALARTDAFLSHPVFNSYHSETEMLRYMNRLRTKDLSLTTSMIPLGSCTMKLNATAEMIAVTWPEFSKLHPFVPLEQAQGYQDLLKRLESMLAEITGFAAVSLQPNAGSQGEYAGLLVIRKHHQSRGEGHRRVCLIPQSAHGTNPASAAMAGMHVVVVKCDDQGNIDVSDLRAKAVEHQKDLAALMVTYPSTHGVFEEAIIEIAEIIHLNGGQVYMDGANMNAQVGLCRPGDFGADVCHLNLHKTFCIPHGGGGPGMGPIGVAAHLAPFLPSHPVIATGGARAIAPISAAPWGSASILPISYAYIRMMGVAGLKLATETAILNANYIARRLEPHYPVLYKGKQGFVAHECIVDIRPIKAATGVDVEDIAKRLMDYGFHAPTISFPVPGTMMIEPTESESLTELDRFCEAMVSIRGEITEIETGKADAKNNVLKNAPHTAEQVTRTEWTRPYPREKGAYPLKGLRQDKFWPAVARIDNVYGERNLFCACPPVEAYEE